MTEELKTPYEISVWRDVEKEYKTPTENYDFTEQEGGIYTNISKNLLKFPSIKSVNSASFSSFETKTDSQINRRTHIFKYINSSSENQRSDVIFDTFEFDGEKQYDESLFGCVFSYQNIKFKKKMYKLNFKDNADKLLFLKFFSEVKITTPYDTPYGIFNEDCNVYTSLEDYTKLVDRVKDSNFSLIIETPIVGEETKYNILIGNSYLLEDYDQNDWKDDIIEIISGLETEMVDIGQIKNGSDSFLKSLLSIDNSQKELENDNIIPLPFWTKIEEYPKDNPITLIDKKIILPIDGTINHYAEIYKYLPTMQLWFQDGLVHKPNLYWKQERTGFSDDAQFAYAIPYQQFFVNIDGVQNKNLIKAVNLPFYIDFDNNENSSNNYSFRFAYITTTNVFAQLDKIQFYIPSDTSIEFELQLGVKEIFQRENGELFNDNTITDKNMKEIANTFSSFEYLDEQKIITIGSDKMQGLNKAYSPKLTQSITGITTLTFSLYAKYFDDKVQDFVENPFLDFLNNETKIKLNRNGEWFDFLIKSKEEDSEEHIVNYICKDIHATSLGKQGFDITLSKDLFNNQGTVKELADIVLEESDWQQDKSEKTGTEIILEKREETLYKITLDKINSNKYGYLYKQNEKCYFSRSEEGTGTLEVYAHYSDLIAEHKEGDLISCYLADDHFVSRPDGSFTISGIDNLKKNENGVVDDEENLVYFRFFESSESSDKEILKNREVTKYRSKKVVASNITKYIPELEKYIQVYEKDGKEFYNYTDIDYVTPELVSELMVNGGAENGDEGILSDEGWLTIDYYSQPLNFSSEILEKTDQDFKESISGDSGIKNGDYSSAVKGYILIGGTSPIVTICNTGINSNKSILKNLTIGDNFIFEINCSKSSISAAYYPRISIISYTSEGFIEIRKLTEVLKVQKMNTNSPFTWIFELQVKDSFTEEELKNSQLALVFDSLNNTKTKIFKASLYREVFDENGYLISPIYSLRENPNNWEKLNDDSNYYNPTSSMPTPSIKIKNNIYNPSKEGNETIFSAEDLIYEYQGYDTPESQGYIAKTTNEKIRNIEANKSNRFNILQSLSEAFSCWCKFRVDHEEDGRIKLSSPPVRQEKYVSFHNFIGDLNPIGVKYGINEKGIQRTIESDSFTTKLIVQENVNQYAKNGVCTVARAKDNPSKDDTIYNLDYYIQMNLLGENARKDLDTYLHKMGKFSENLQELVDKETAMNTTKISTEADFTTWDNLVNEAEKELIELKSDFLETYNCSTDELKTTTEWPKGIYKDEELGEFVTGFKEDFINILTLEVKLGNPSDGTTNATGYYLELQNAKAAFEKAKNEYENILLELDIISNNRKSITKEFNQKYGLYLQEGTWSSKDYIDDDLYYLDALQTLALSAKPKISYQISAVDLHNQEGYEAYNYVIGNRTTIEDTEFFGWTLKKNGDEFIRTPYKEDIVISEISTFLDDASQDTITVQNYREQFEDLFQKMSAETQALQFKEGNYDNAAGAVGSNGQILPDAITNTFNNASFIIKHSGQQGLVWDDNGITVTDQGNKAKIVRIAGGVIEVSGDKKNTWHTAIDGDGIKADVITAGVLNITTRLNIKSGDHNAFTWNSDGINAYLYENDKLHLNDKITFNQYGLFGGLAIGTNLSDPFMQELANIHKNSRFALTWKGFSLKTGHADSTGYVSIDSDDDITLNVKPSGSSNYLKIIQIGHLESIASTSASDAGESTEPASQSSESGHYGIRVKDMTGNVILETTEKHVNGRFHINCGTW